jgi:hypothetical protein
MLAERCRTLPPDGENPDAAGMAKMWTEAVLEHQRGALRSHARSTPAFSRCSPGMRRHTT